MKSVLFVDDHEVLARLSCEILEMSGYRAISAYSAMDALQRFEKEPVDIVVTDWKMEGMDGLELARRIRAKSPDTPVILVTGYGPIETGDEIAVCLAKDRLFPELLQRIREFLNEPESPETEPEVPVRTA